MTDPERFIPEDPLIRRLASEAERHQPLSDELNNYPFVERLALARKVAALVSLDNYKHPEIPPLQLQVKTALDKFNHAHLIGLKRLSAGAAPEELYHLPGKIEQFPNMDTQLNMDTFYSNNIANKGREYFPLPLQDGLYKQKKQF